MLKKVAYKKIKQKREAALKDEAGRGRETSFFFFYLALVAIWITFWMTGQTRVKSYRTNLRVLSI